MKTIVLGPPGTGKTTTLLNLVEDFLRDGVDIKKIGYFSFTKKAAYEAISRAEERFVNVRGFLVRGKAPQRRAGAT